MKIEGGLFQAPADDEPPGPAPSSIPARCRPSPVFFAACLSQMLAAADSPGNQAQPEKSGYHLFRPTPRELMREMSTDRPDQTESPNTVDAGHFQVEMDFVSATIDRDRSDGGDVRTDVYGVAPLNLKVGLLNNVDLQFVLDTYVDSRIEDRVAGTVDKASGFGDLQTRLKINFWGNDGGRTAFAMMPFVKWPLSSSDLRNGDTEGGVIFILGHELPAGWSSAVMTEADFVSDGSGGHDTEFVNSITFSHAIVGELGGYVEFFSVVSTAADSAWQGQADVGFTYAVNDNTQLDLGCNFGVTDSAPDFNPFIGLSFRF